MNDNFLPNDYNIPQKSNYTRFEQGETILRILESPILGWEIWKDNKPVRFDMDEEIPIEVADSADVDKLTGMPRAPRHFWAMVVWNYEAKCLQIWEITQKSIMSAIKGLSKSKAWGSPLNYDLSITKEGEGFETTYSVMPCPKEKLGGKIAQAYKSAKIDVKKLYSGDDPFMSQKNENEASSESTSTEGREVEDISEQIPF